MSEIGIKITALLLSFFLSISSVVFACFLMYHFNNRAEIPEPKLTETQTTTERYFPYFSVTAQMTVICNVLCCFTVTMYCILIMINAEHDLLWFIALRATVGVCWFLGKASLIWLYNGRLYYAFSRSALQSSYTLFVTLNIIIAVAAPLCLILGFVGVYNGVMWLISVGFEGFRLIYLVLTGLLLFMFTNRLLSLQRLAAENTDVSTSQNIQTLFFFINVASKNAVLVLFISISALLVVAAWTIHDYVLVMDYMALLLPLLMFSLDSVLTSFCICLLFNFAKMFYENVCKSCDVCCKSLCIRSSSLKELELKVVKSNVESDRTATQKSDATVTISIH